jgi:uncharacterized membrane protein affecting hemolysin expression
MVRDHIQAHQRTPLTPAVLIFGVIAIAVTLYLNIEGFRSAHSNQQNRSAQRPIRALFGHRPVTNNIQPLFLHEDTPTTRVFAQSFIEPRRIVAASKEAGVLSSE